MLPNLTKSHEPEPLGKKNQEPKPLEKKKSEAGAAKKFASSPALQESMYVRLNLQRKYFCIYYI